MKTDISPKLANIFSDMHGRVAAPLLMWAMGVPGGLVLILWFFFFRGK